MKWIVLFLISICMEVFAADNLVSREDSSKCRQIRSYYPDDNSPDELPSSFGTTIGVTVVFRFQIRQTDQYYALVSTQNSNTYKLGFYGDLFLTIKMSSDDIMSTVLGSCLKNYLNRIEGDIIKNPLIVITDTLAPYFAGSHSAQKSFTSNTVIVVANKIANNAQELSDIIKTINQLANCELITLNELKVEKKPWSDLDKMSFIDSETLTALKKVYPHWFVDQQ